jgi:hypothetical protein
MVRRIRPRSTLPESTSPYWLRTKAETGVVKKDYTVKGALIAATAALLGSAFTFTGTIIASDKPPEKTCAAVIKEYYDAAIKNRGMVDVLTSPDPGGQSPIDADPAAKRCHFDSAKLRKLMPGT